MQPAERLGGPDEEVEVADTAASSSGLRIPKMVSKPPPTVAEGRPPARWLRWFKAYWTTFRVIWSYTWLRFQSRFRSPEAMARLLKRKHIRNAQRIEKAICQLQGLYIKVGQLISIMTNFLPPDFRDQLEGLQDHVPPRPYADIEERLTDELGAPPKELFAEFSERPIASASIGQVHLARLKTGEKVAVKVQYPGIEEIVQSDLKTLKRIFGIVEFFTQFAGLEDVYREICTMLLEELDFSIEASNAARVGQNFTEHDDVSFPRVVEQLSTTRVLTTHFEEGVKVSDLAKLKELGIDRKILARKVIELYCKQIFTDGVYHADPHPGNILVRPCKESEDGICVVFLDFGAVAEVSENMRNGIINLLQAALTRDTPRIVTALRQMGFVSRTADPAVFDRIVEYFHERFQEEISLDSFNLKDIKIDPEKGLENLADLRRMDISLRELTAQFHVPKDWILLERTLLLLMGLCTTLAPQMNPMEVIRPYIERFVLGEEADWSTFVVDTTKDLVMSVTALPGDMRKFMRTAERGELAVEFRNLDRNATLMYRLGHQLIYVAIGVAGATLAVVLEGRGDYQRADYAWWTARASGAMLLWSWWTTRGWLKRR